MSSLTLTAAPAAPTLKVADLEPGDQVRYGFGARRQVVTRVTHNDNVSCFGQPLTRVDVTREDGSLGYFYAQGDGKVLA